MVPQVASFAASALQTGQAFFTSSHFLMQPAWKSCPHFSFPSESLCLYSSYSQRMRMRTNLPNQEYSATRLLAIMIPHSSVILPGKLCIFPCLDHSVYGQNYDRLAPSRSLRFFRQPGQCLHCQFVLPTPGAPVHDNIKSLHLHHFPVSCPSADLMLL